MVNNEPIMMQRSGCLVTNINTASWATIIPKYAPINIRIPTKNIDVENSYTTSDTSGWWNVDNIQVSYQVSKGAYAFPHSVGYDDEEEVCRNTQAKQLIYLSESGSHQGLNSIDGKLIEILRYYNSRSYTPTYAVVASWRLSGSYLYVSARSSRREDMETLLAIVRSVQIN